MATWTAIPTSDIDAESPLKTETMVALRDNDTALTEGATGAPKIQEAAMDTASVNQAALKTTTHAISTASTHLLTTFNGGEYGFWPNIYNATSTQLNMALLSSHITSVGTYTTIGTTLGGTYVNRITLGVGGGTIFAQQRYIQASPPYNDGPLFIYVIIDKSGNIETVSIAPDPPWANNGPTNIRPDYFKDGKGYKKIKKAKRNNGKLVLPIQYDISEQEITLDYKDSDMNLIPHSFQGNDLSDKTIAIIEPGSDLCCELYELHETGENVNEIIHDGYLVIDNEPLKRKAPKECIAVSAKWKFTK